MDLLGLNIVTSGLLLVRGMEIMDMQYSLGQGSSGKVVLARASTDDGVFQVAIKMMASSNVDPEYVMVSIIKRLVELGKVPVLDPARPLCFELPLCVYPIQQNDALKLGLVMRAGTSLGTWAQDNEVLPVGSEYVSRVVASMLTGVWQLNGAGVNHQDLKLDNMLVFGETTRSTSTVARDASEMDSTGVPVPPSTFSVRIVDFGSAGLQPAYDAGGKDDDFVSPASVAGVSGITTKFADQPRDTSEKALRPAADTFSLMVAMIHLARGGTMPPYFEDNCKGVGDERRVSNQKTSAVNAVLHGSLVPEALRDAPGMQEALAEDFDNTTTSALFGVCVQDVLDNDILGVDPLYTEPPEVLAARSKKRGEFFDLLRHLNTHNHHTPVPSPDTHAYTKNVHIE